MEQEAVFSRWIRSIERPKMMDFESVLNTIMDKQNEILIEINSLKQELREEREEICLEKELLSVELKTIKSQLSNCKGRLMFFERKERSKNLIIFGIYEAQNEDVKTTIDSMIGERLGIGNH